MGSFLKRPCTCHLMSRQFCVAHRLQQFVRGRPQGSRLWTSSSHQLLATIRRILGALLMDCPNEYTLKMFRAGRATALAEEAFPRKKSDSGGSSGLLHLKPYQSEALPYQREALPTSKMLLVWRLCLTIGSLFSKKRFSSKAPLGPR